MKRSFVLALCLFAVNACATQPYRVRESQFPDRLSYLRYCQHYWLGRNDICID